MQFACVFPVMRREILCAASRSKEKDGLLGGRSKEMASLKTQTERGACHLRDEQFSLREPGHVARKYVLRSNAAVSLPSIVEDQVAREHFMTLDWRTFRIFLAASIEERLPATVKPK